VESNKSKIEAKARRLLVKKMRKKFEKEHVKEVCPRMIPRPRG